MIHSVIIDEEIQTIVCESFAFYGRTQKIGSKINNLAPLSKICDSFKFLILLLVEEKVLVAAGVVGPDVLDILVRFALVLNLL